MSKINLTPNASGTGVFTIASPNSNTDRTFDLPDEAGTILTTSSSITQNSGPAFSVYKNANQTLSSATITKIQFDGEEFDTDNAFDSTTNYRFQPATAGYYVLHGVVTPNASYSAGAQGFYKNGSLYKWGAYNANATGVSQPAVSCLVYLNGSTDYVEFYASFTTGQNMNCLANTGNTAFSWLQGYLVRTA
jgi:hypothetical protein